MSRPTLRIAAAQSRAARVVCRQASPGWFFASQLLAPPRRQAAWCLGALWQQLVIIMQSDQANDADHAAVPTAAADLASGCGCHGQDSRRTVCSAVLEHLFTGQATGRPELDAFPNLIEPMQLQREDFEQAVDGLAPGQARLATWPRLLDEAMRLARPLAHIGWRLLQPWPTPDTQAFATARQQAASLLAATILVHRLWGMDDAWRRGRLVVPLDDLFQAGLTESDVGRFSDAGSVAGDERWATMMGHLSRRIELLIRGGVKCSESVDGAPQRAAVGHVAATCLNELAHLRRVGFDCFAHTPRRLSLWTHLTTLPQAIRLTRPSRG